MTKSDWKKVVIWSSVSIIIGILVLTFVLIRSKQKLKKHKLKRLVDSDIKQWRGINETHPKGLGLIQQYWRVAGHDFSIDQLATGSHRATYPWSAAYISSLMHRWGAGDRFPYSAAHAVYIVDAKRNRTKNTNGIFKAYRTGEVPVEVGDLLAVDRGFGITYDNVRSDSKTHTDLVFDIEKTNGGFIAKTIGGNISDTVKVRSVNLDKTGRVISSNYFAILKNTST